MIKINILADSKYPVDRKMLRQRLTRILAEHKLVDAVEMSVLIVGKRKMIDLHIKHMNLSGTTDVLSFPLMDVNDDRPFVASPNGRLQLGDVVVCYPVAIEQAFKKQVKLDEEVCFLAEHGLMHLLGHHHGDGI